MNPADVMNRQRGVFVGKPPFVLGWDVSGTLEAVGPGVTLYKPGDEVFGMLPFPHGHGAYAVGPARVFVPKPERLDHVQAAAIPLAGLFVEADRLRMTALADLAATAQSTKSGHGKTVLTLV